MAKKLFWLTMGLLIILSLVITSCNQTSTSQPPKGSSSATSAAPPASTAAAKPKYGGTFTYRIKADPQHFDPYNLSGGDTQTVQKLYMETLAGRDLSIDRSKYDFKTTYTPVAYSRGVLSQKWEISSDYKTYTFHLRPGIHWQDIAPMNGRELTANDVEWNWHRELGLGSGFTKPNPYYAGNYSQIQSVTAADKYTVVFQMKAPSLTQLTLLLDEVSYGHVVAPEAVKQWGDVEDWKHAIGTGPFILKDYTSGSSVTGVKNPKYWGTDEANPGNILPYFDTVKFQIIPDDATAMSGLRSGNIDLVEDVDWQQTQSLTSSKPELKKVARPINSDSIVLMVDKKPFDDIKVRKALQMSIDLKKIAQSFYGGSVSPTPMGLVGIPGYYTPYEQWPKEVQDGYAYNPDGAKKLLADAGYPNGFKTTLTVASNSDTDLWQIIKAYFKAINVDMEIQVMEPTAYSAYVLASKHEMMGSTGSSGSCPTYPPMNALNQRNSGQARAYAWGHVKDPVYDDLWKRANTSVDETEFKKLVKEADDYNIKQQWVVNILPKVNYCIYQPWIHGYNGETGFTYGQLFARMWTDKK